MSDAGLMQRTGVVGSTVPSLESVRPRVLRGETSSTRMNEGLASPCAAVGVRLRSLVPNGRGKLKPSFVGVPALLPLIVLVAELCVGHPETSLAFLSQY